MHLQNINIAYGLHQINSFYLFYTFAYLSIKVNQEVNMKRDFKRCTKKDADNRITSLVLRLKERLGRHRAEKKAMENHRELLKLGEHLLRDLGFDKEGNPLNPRPGATINMPRTQAQPSAKPPYQGVAARNRRWGKRFANRVYFAIF